MKITRLHGGGCVGDPIVVQVSDCADPDNVEWTFPYLPQIAFEPAITPLGDGKHEIIIALAGAYVIEGECCG